MNDWLARTGWRYWGTVGSTPAYCHPDHGGCYCVTFLRDWYETNPTATLREFCEFRARQPGEQIT